MFFELHRDESGMYRWEAKGEDGQTLCSSVPAPTRGACLAAILIVKHGAAGANVYNRDDRSAPLEGASHRRLRGPQFDEPPQT